MSVVSAISLAANIPISGRDGTISVNSRSKEAEQLRIFWELTEALMGGTIAMRLAAETYLPAWPNEEPASYADRLSRSTCFPAYRRTVVTLASRPFSKPITINDDVPAPTKKWLEDCDLQGNNLNAFMSETFKWALADGFCGVLVEMPVKVKKPEGQVVTVADEKAAGIRPYFVRVRMSQILGWRIQTSVSGVQRLMMLRILEEVEEPLGEFGTVKIEQVRVLEPGRWRLYRAGASASAEWVLADEGTTSLDEIPFVAVYGERMGMMMSKPPLLELAHLNVKHWQHQSDQDNLMHVARVPILTTRGTDDKFKLVIGSSAAVALGDNPTAEMMYVEHSGAAIGAGKISLDDLKDEMRQSGAEMLVMQAGKTGGPATATEVSSDNAVGMCALQEMTINQEDATNQALQFMADYMKLGEGGHVVYFKDFAAATLADASYQMLIAMSSAGKLSTETLISEGKRRGILGVDVEWDEEKDRMTAEGPPVGQLPMPGGPPGRGIPPPPSPAGPPKPTFGKGPAK